MRNGTLILRDSSQMWWYMSVIPAILEVESRGTWFEASLSKKLGSPHLNKQGMVAHACNHSYKGGVGKSI
jgi:hypothetical protein